MKLFSIFQFPSRQYSICRYPPFEILGEEGKSQHRRSSGCYRQGDILSRSFLQFRGVLRNTTKEFAGRKLVGYSTEQMYNVVSDVENYYTFIPFCKKSLVRTRSASHLRADLVIGFPPIVEKYTSSVTLIRPSLVKAVCTEGRLFNHLLTTWKFSPGLKNNLQTSIIDFYVSFEFKSSLHSHLAHMFFNEVVRQMEGAFYQEAKARYGKPSIKTQFLHANVHADKES